MGKPRYKVGDYVVVKPRENCRCLITNVTDFTYEYIVYLDRDKPFEQSWEINHFETQTRKLTKLDKALK